MAELVCGERVEHQERVVRLAGELSVAVQQHGDHGFVAGQQSAEVQAHVLGRHVGQLVTLDRVVRLITVVRHQPGERQVGQLVHDVRPESGGGGRDGGFSSGRGGSGTRGDGRIIRVVGSGIVRRGSGNGIGGTDQQQHCGGRVTSEQSPRHHEDDDESNMTISV